MRSLAFAFVLGAGIGLGGPAAAQYFGGQALSLSGGRATNEQAYPRFELEYVTPALHKWYEPRNLVDGYVRPWYLSDERWASELYLRYVGLGLEGQEWYDSFGRRLGRGWLVYTWQQRQQARGGSLIDEGDRFGSTFGSLVIAADGAGGGQWRLMVGDELPGALTPLTFYKPRFDGLRLDFATERTATTVLASRPSQPRTGEVTNATHVAGGHSQFQVAGPATVGLTYVNAHNTNSDREFHAGNPLYGTLTSAQITPLQTLWVRVRDDSPTDPGGATLFRYDIVLVDTSGNEIRGRDIGYLPRVKGGRLEDGALVVEGSETLLLEYDLHEIDGLASAALTAAGVELSIANDYRVEMASDLQKESTSRVAETTFLPYARAVGNVKDDSNGDILHLDYGLPTATEILGVSWNLVDWRGLSVQGEAVVNRQHRMYPSAVRRDFHRSVATAKGGYGILGYNRYPYGVFVEAFHLDDAYASRYWLTLANGAMQYAAPIPMVYEFVDDDDDHDALPEWPRPFQLSSDGVAFPGFDADGDFIYDHNQNNSPRPGPSYLLPGQPPPQSLNRNRNLVPDYEEPFLRFRSDRPEFLFGVDMNHNGTVDRFENDAYADYPYRRDHRGYNAHVKLFATPDLRLLAGHQDMGLLAGDGHTDSWYVMTAYQRRLPGGGRLRVFEFGALVRDDIADDLQAWVQPVGSVGRMRDVPDPLANRDTWRHTLYGDLEQRLGAGLRFSHRAKWEALWQRRPRAQIEADEGRRRSGFLGLINRAEWTIPIGMGVLEPRWKSEYRLDRPYTTRLPASRGVEETAYLLWSQPLLSEKASVNYFARYGRQLFDTELQLGLEVSRFWLLEGRREVVDQDHTSRTVVAQLINRVGYQGYQLITRAGVRLGHTDFELDEDESSSLLFLTMNAGLR